MNKPRKSHLSRAEHSLLLVVDVQERLLPHIHDAGMMVAAIEKLVRAAGVLGVAVMATEQNPRGLGKSAAAIRNAWPGTFSPMSKETFSCCGDAEIMMALLRDKPEHIVVVGIETHVCVQQTVLHLRDADQAVIVVADAVSSRRAMDRDVALRRMESAGAAITTTESLIMEWQQRYTSDTFRTILGIIK